jgi:hypothetical protein
MQSDEEIEEFFQRQCEHVLRLRFGHPSISVIDMDWGRPDQKARVTFTLANENALLAFCGGVSEAEWEAMQPLF